MFTKSKEKDKKNKKKCTILFKLNRYVYRIILSGDIKTNSRPGFSKPEFQVCDKTVQCNQKRLVFEYYLEMYHVKCSNHQLNSFLSHV